jgi:twitching motility protein PilI
MSGISRSTLPTRPFALLQQVEAHSLAHNVGIPEVGDVREQWSGTGFRVGRQRFVAPMGEVMEILPYPEVSRIPRALPWLKGIANIRGNLLPVMDLRGFLTGEATPIQRQTRVLVIQQQSVYTGLLVDESLGIRRFYADDRLERAEGIDSRYSECVEGMFHDEFGDFAWYIFSMKKLAENPQLVRAAA